MRNPARWLVTVLFLVGAMWGASGVSRLLVLPLTPEQTVERFFLAWARGDRGSARALLLRPDRLWNDFGQDVRSLRLVKLDRPLRSGQREAEYRRTHGHHQVTMVRATFDVRFWSPSAMPDGRNVYTYILVRRWPWSPWRIADWTSQP